MEGELILQLLFGFLFFGGVGWSNLQIFKDFQLQFQWMGLWQFTICIHLHDLPFDHLFCPLLFLSCCLLSSHYSEHFLLKPPKMTQKHGRYVGFKQGIRILGTAKLCALLNWAPSCLEPLVLRKAVSCASWQVLEGRSEESKGERRDQEMIEK